MLTVPLEYKNNLLTGHSIWPEETFHRWITTCKYNWELYSRLEQRPVKMTPMSVIVHCQWASLHNHKCFCSPSITLFISLIFLKTLASSLHNRDPKLCCRRNRNKLYIRFAPAGSEVIGLAITPAFLANSWRPREAWPNWVLLQQRAVIHCQWAQSWKAGQLPSWGKGKAQSWQACQCECQRSWEKNTAVWGHLKRKSLRTPTKAVPGPAAPTSGGILRWDQRGNPCSILHCKPRAGGICTANSNPLQISVKYSLTTAVKVAYTCSSDIKKKMPGCQEKSTS